MVATFKLKAPRYSNGVQCKALILKSNSLSPFTAQLRASRHVTCLRLPQRAFGKGGILRLHFRKTGRDIAVFTLQQMCRLFYLKRATVCVSPEDVADAALTEAVTTLSLAGLTQDQPAGLAAVFTFWSLYKVISESSMKRQETCRNT